MSDENIALGGSQAGNEDWRSKIVHDLRQPLNVIRMTAENLRLRTLPKLVGEDLDYLQAKLARIDEQIDRAEEILKKLRQF